MTGPTTAHVSITVTAPTAENASQWATTIGDLVQAEFGDTMRLAVHVTTGADRTALRNRIAEALLDHLSRTADIRPDRNGDLAFMPEITDAERMRIAEHLATALPAPADRAAVLDEAERTMLTYALDQAQEKIWSEDGFTDEDQAAITSLRRMTVEAQQQTETQAEIVHGCPPDGSGLTPCCGRTPFELPLGDRISSEAPITCTGPAAGAQQPKETSNPRTVCVCGHTRAEHLTVSGRLLCDACDPDSTDNLVCRGFEAL